MGHIKLVSFDLDGTLTKCPIFRYVMEKKGFKHTLEYLNKVYGSNIQEKLNAIRDIAIGMSVEELYHYLDEIPKVKNIKETVEKLKSYNVEVIILTDVPSCFKEYFEKFGFDNFIGLEAKVENGKIVSNERNLSNKLERLKNYCDVKGYSLSECVHVGDNVNDIVVFEKVFGIAFNPKTEETAKSAKICIYSDDLYDVVNLLEPMLIGRNCKR
jgi:HAD superfamily phosphoserine phosphatase-like hydrolase